MRMRKGNRGSDMFEQCLIHGLAAIHYNPIESIDLSQYSEFDLPDAWSELKSSQSGSLKKFAWRIKGGDTIYVAESYPSRIVGVGRVRGAQEVVGYFYDPQTPIVDDDLNPWRHLRMNKFSVESWKTGPTPATPTTRSRPFNGVM